MRTNPLGILALLLCSSVGCQNMMTGNDTGTSDVPRADSGTGLDGSTGNDAAPSDATDDTGSNSCGSGLGPCNPVTNAGCMTGQSCVRVMSGTTLTTQCITAGTGGMGGTCAGPEDCREGFVCLSTGTCQKLCCGTGDDATCRDTATGGVANATCSIQIGNPGGGASGLFGCSLPVRCDVWAQTGCAAMKGCVYTRADGTTDCITTGTATDGAACGATAACAAGFLCIDETGGSKCRKFCNPRAAGDAGAEMTCPTGKVCAGVNMLPTTFGVCVTM